MSILKLENVVKTYQKHIAVNEVSFEVYSANGILLENIVLAANSFRQEIDLSTYPSGMYVLILNFDGQRQKTIRLIKE